MCWWKRPSDFLLGPCGTWDWVAFSGHRRWICRQSRFSMLYFLSLSFIRVIPQDPENHGIQSHHDTINRERRAGLSPIYQLCCKDKQACWYPVWKCVFPSNIPISYPNDIIFNNEVRSGEDTSSWIKLGWCWIWTFMRSIEPNGKKERGKSLNRDFAITLGVSPSQLPALGVFYELAISVGPENSVQLRQAGTWDPLLQCLHLDTPLLEPQDTKML